MRIFDNFLYKVVAVLIAALLWAAAQGVADVREPIDLEVAFVDTPKDIMVVEGSHPVVNIQLQGSRAAHRQAQRELKEFPVSLAGVKPGSTEYPLDVRALTLPRNAKVLTVSPSRIIVEVDSIIERELPVRVDVDGEPPAGFRIVSVKPDPGRVRLSGAQRTLRGVREISTQPLDVSELRESGTFEVPLALADLAHLDPAKEIPIIRVELRVEAPPLPQVGNAAPSDGE